MAKAAARGRRRGAAATGTGSEFYEKWGLTRLVPVEAYPTMPEAIAREKAMKRWKQASKIRLIEEAHPDRDDLHLTIDA